MLSDIIVQIQGGCKAQKVLLHYPFTEGYRHIQLLISNQHLFLPSGHTMGASNIASVSQNPVFPVSGKSMSPRLPTEDLSSCH